MDYLYICKKGTTMWNEMSNPAVLMRIGQHIKGTRISSFAMIILTKSILSLFSLPQR